MRSFLSIALLHSPASLLLATLTTLVIPPPSKVLTPVSQILQTHAPSLTTYKATAATNVQNVRPLATQRGVGLDGSLRAGPMLPMHLAGNPFENVWNGHEKQGDLRIDTGSYHPSDVDLALPANGFPWVIGRTYNARNTNSGASQFDSDGPMGRNWHLSSQPEIVFYADGGGNADDLIYCVYRADAYVEFKRAATNSNQFKGVNGAAGCFEYQAGTPDLYVYTDQHGYVFTFLGFDTSGNTYNGLLWKVEDPDGNLAYVGHPSTVATAISTGWDASGRITTAFDASARRFSYSYSASTIGGKKRLESVVAETKSGVSWSSPGTVTEVGRVEYSYYGDEDHGDSGDLKEVTITTPLSDTGEDLVTQVKKKLYRYWEGEDDGVSDYDAEADPPRLGFVHEIKYVFDYEGVRRFDWNWGDDHDFDGDELTEADTDMNAYAATYLEYDTDRRVSRAWFNGCCGCGGGTNGIHDYAYGTNPNYSDGSGYDTAWAKRTVVARPDGSYLTQYFDENGAGLSSVLTDGDPSGSPATWVTQVVRDEGCVTEIHMPDNKDTYTFHDGMTPANEGKVVPLPSDGLVHLYVRETSGDLTGFLLTQQFQEGTGGPANYERETSWDATTLTKTITDVKIVRPLVYTTRVYPLPGTTTDSDFLETVYATSAWSSTLMPETVVTTFPAVSDDNDGPDAATTKSVHYRKDGRLDFELRQDGRVDVHAYADGQQTLLVEDYETGGGDPFASPGGELQRQISYAYTAQGMSSSQTVYGLDSGSMGPQTYRSRLADQRMVVLHFPDSAPTVPLTYFGPVRFEVVNHAGKTEVSGIIALTSNETDDEPVDFIDEGESDTLTAIDLGTVKQMRTSLLEESGTRITEERAYFSVPGSGAGTEGTHYDSKHYAYDGMGRRWRTKEASGTIQRTVFDAIGRHSESWMGTNDLDFTDGESSGSDNMVRTELRAYDGGSAGKNSYLTSRTLFVEGSSTGQRVTTYLNDLRGRAIVELSPNAPYVLRKLDNLGRETARGLYSSSSGLDATDDPTSLDTNRLTLNESVYDELGRVWMTIRHKIDQADGSDDDNIETRYWFDEEGRTIKVQGEEFKKTFYDRLGRVTDEFVLAKDDDTDYAAAKTVTGDIVLEQHEIRYSGTKPDVLMEITLQRKHNDISTGETSGPLDTNDDSSAHNPMKLTASDAKGRPQITAYWYDQFGRRTDTVQYGTYNDTTFDRADSGFDDPPTRSDTELRTTTAYNTDGTVDTVTDPRGKVTKYVYDARGRRTKEIKNYDSGVNSGNPDGTADNVTVLYGYTNGLRTSLTADMPYPQADQVTTYIYGTTAGTPSAMKVSTGHLLRAVKYPDSSNAGTNQAYIDGSSDADVVSYAYNAQGQETSKKDQAGNVLDDTYDTSGRRTKQTASAVISGFDTAVLRVESSFDTLGRTSEIVQYDATTSGSATDGIKYAYDDWGNISTYEEDRNGAVASDQYTTSYTWAKNVLSHGRWTLRKSGMVEPGGRTLSYTYRSAGGLHDDDYSRVSTIVDSGPGTICQYDYLGVGTVVRTKYNEINCFSRVYDGTPVYADLDRFNRITTSRWSKGNTPVEDFYGVGLSYDRDSNITSAEDNVHTGFDVKYTMDGVNRLTEAQEGTLSAGSITSQTRDEQWTLSHTGNWDRAKLNLNGDGDFTDAGELDDTRTHNDVNELTARDTDSNSSNNYTLTYDVAGNMTDDGKDYKYEYDAWNRLRKVKQTGNSALVAEYRYNGLNHRIGVHEDTDTDNDADSNDKWFYDAFDERWRMLARFRESDSYPKEDFVPHQAGASGNVRNSYNDRVVNRNRDESSSFTASSDGVLETRLYYCQNWRADVSALVTSGSVLKEWVKYSAYGMPIGLPAGDTDSDGDCDGTDVSAVGGHCGSSCDVRRDLDLDGDVDTYDDGLVSGMNGTTLGRGVLSATAVTNRRGNAGHEALAGLVGGKRIARNRGFAADLGRWIRQDPSHYLDGPNVYQGTRSSPIVFVDFDGDLTLLPSGSAPGGGGRAPGETRPGGPDPCEEGPPCACFRKRWLEDPDNKNIPPLGGTACWNGHPVMCNFVDNYPFGWADSGGELMAHVVISECVDAHEANHASHCDCSETDSGYSDCGGDPNEPSAYDAEVDCYRTAEDRCNKAGDAAAQDGCKTKVDAERCRACSLSSDPQQNGCSDCP